MSLLINGKMCSRLFFAGILGSGMSALAQYARWMGCAVSGSDRLIGTADSARTEKILRQIGCEISPQDGTGVTTGVDALVVSTAIEESNPDIQAARASNVAIVHRSDLLAAFASTKTTVAVAGTSGKSTVTAMIFELFCACGKKPSLISGAAIKRLEGQGNIGNAWFDSGEVLVIEADESDGSIVKYHDTISLILNISKDHKSEEEVLAMFTTLSEQSRYVIINADDGQLAGVPHSHTFGVVSTRADCKPDSLSFGAKIQLQYSGVDFSLALPGRHNASNLMAALCVCNYLGCDLSLAKTAVASYQGVARRFDVTKTARGVTVIDDYAHNPEKVKAAIEAAHGMGKRLFAVFQPHGYGPLRFFKNELIEAFAQSLKETDQLFVLPIYYAGGTAQKDISSGDVVDGLKSAKFKSFAPVSKEEMVEMVLKEVKGGDCVMVMGARDPGLPGLVREICERLKI